MASTYYDVKKGDLFLQNVGNRKIECVVSRIKKKQGGGFICFAIAKNYADDSEFEVSFNYVRENLI